MVLCSYCGKEKDEDELSKEHVVPRGLGGVFEPTNPFLLKTVCRRCNNACGRHVDGPFLRSWFVSNERATNALRFTDPAQNPILPLTFIGQVKTLHHEDRLCDLWLGPSGDRVYHFHRPYPGAETMRGHIGAPFNTPPEEIDEGFVFLFLRATNPVWHGPIVLSVMEQIDDATIFMGNSNLPGGGGHPRFKEVPAELSDLHEQLRALNGQQHEVQFEVRIDAGDRFLGKLALGFGALFLDPTFLTSQSATTLRNFMWTQDRSMREELQVRGTAFFGDRDAATLDVLAWKPGHIFYLHPAEPSLGLTALFYGSQVASIEVTSEAAHWRGRIHDQGEVYVIAPGLRRWCGPIRMPEYVAARLGHTGGVPSELVDILSASENVPPLPPFELPG